MNSFYPRFSLALLTIAALFGPVNAAEIQPTLFRQLLLEKAVTLPSNAVDTKLIRVRFPSGFKTPLHTHEGPGPRYVLKGHLKVEDAGQTQVYGPGDVFWETGAAMTVQNVSGGDAELVIFELTPAK